MGRSGERKYGGKKITKLFNKIFEGKGFPEEWKWGVLQPIYKNKGDRSDPSNYRGITLLETINKIYTGILAKRRIK